MRNWRRRQLRRSHAHATGPYRAVDPWLGDARSRFRHLTAARGRGGDGSTDSEWHSVAGVQRAHEASLDRLGLDYLDLLLVHWPNPDQDHYVDAVRGLGELLDSGALRAIGTSNFKPAHLQRVLDETGIVPDVNQIQLNPYTTREASRAFDAEHQIVTESYSPIGANSDLRSDPVINEVARHHGKSAAQVILRWHVQLGLVPIPKSGNPDRMAENFDIFDFELADADMDAITRLDRGENQATDSDVFGH